MSVIKRVLICSSYTIFVLRIQSVYCRSSPTQSRTPPSSSTQVSSPPFFFVNSPYTVYEQSVYSIRIVPRIQSVYCIAILPQLFDSVAHAAQFFNTGFEPLLSSSYTVRTLYTNLRNLLFECSILAVYEAILRQLFDSLAQFFNTASSSSFLLLSSLELSDAKVYEP